MFRRFIITLATACFAIAAAAATDANRANQAELESVKGIGPGLSGRILQARQSAPFKDWADLIERVPGVGAGNAKRYSQAGLTVGGVAFDSATMQPAPKQGPRERRERASDGEVKPSPAPRKAREPREPNEKRTMGGAVKN